MNQTDILLKIAKDAFSISYIKWVRWSRLSNTILISFGRKDLYKDIGEHSNFIQNIWYFSLQNNSLWKKSHILNSKKYPKDNFLAIQLPYTKVLINQTKYISTIKKNDTKQNNTAQAYSNCVIQRRKQLLGKGMLTKTFFVWIYFVLKVKWKILAPKNISSF